ncbi:MAG: TolC family protein [Prevotellaceae bacterium]|jgi:outer membrane protein|nr:TolC family protein [Prevotellaceae bacterium]
MGKKIVLFIGILAFTSGVYTQNSTSDFYSFSLENCLNYAFSHNYNLQSMQLSEQASAAELKQSKQERLPSLSASVGQTLSHQTGNSAAVSGNAGINAGMTLYQGGAITKTIEQNKLKKELSGLQTSQYVNNLTIQILQAFLTAVGNEELLKYQQNVIAASQEQWKQGKAQYDYGKILESDCLLLEAQLASDQNNVTNTQITLGNNMLALKNLLAMPATDSLKLLSPDTLSISAMGLLPPLANVLSEANNALPDLKINQYNINIANLNLKIAKGNYLPTVSLSGSIGTGHSDFDNFGTQLSNRFNQQAGISVSIPIYDKGRAKAQVQQSKIALQQAELDKKQNELDINKTITEDYQNVVSAYNRYRTTQILQNAHSKSFEAYRHRFNAGSITVVELLQQQNNYLNALTDYIQSKYELILKRKILDLYMGKNISL